MLPLCSKRQKLSLRTSGYPNFRKPELRSVSIDIPLTFLLHGWECYASPSDLRCTPHADVFKATLNNRRQLRAARDDLLCLRNFLMALLHWQADPMAIGELAFSRIPAYLICSIAPAKRPDASQGFARARVASDFRARGAESRSAAPRERRAH